MIFKINSYDRGLNDCECTMSDGTKRRVDPFVAAYIMSDDEYENGKGAEMVGRSFDVPYDTPFNGITMLPLEGEMIEVFDA